MCTLYQQIGGLSRGQPEFCLRRKPPSGCVLGVKEERRRIDLRDHETYSNGMASHICRNFYFGEDGAASLLFGRKESPGRCPGLGVTTPLQGSGEARTASDDPAKPDCR